METSWICVYCINKEQLVCIGSGWDQSIIASKLVFHRKHTSSLPPRFLTGGGVTGMYLILNESAVNDLF